MASGKISPPSIDQRAARIVGGTCGVLGAIALSIYFSFPVKPPTVTADAAVVDLFGRQHPDAIMLVGWLQAVGSMLCVVFFLALVHVARARERLAGSVVLVGSAVLVGLSLVESVLLMNVAEAAAHGHAEAALTTYDLQTVFVHAFLTVAAPTVYLGTGLILVRSRVLPSVFAWLAIALAVVFEVLGFVGLFNSASDTVAIVPLIAQALWILVGAGMLVFSAFVRRDHASESEMHQRPEHIKGA